MTLGLWDDDVPEEPGARDLPEPARELEAGRAALVAGRFDEAILRFGLALRLAPALAPAVLEATAGARASGLLMVRGDAYRLAGHEDEAREAYLAAARGGLPERRRRSRTRPAKTEPAVHRMPMTAEAAASAEPRSPRREADPSRRRRPRRTAARATRRRPSTADAADNAAAPRRRDGRGRQPPATPPTRQPGPRPTRRPDPRRPSDTIPRVQPRPHPRKTCQAPNEPSSSSSPTASSAS